MSIKHTVIFVSLDCKPSIDKIVTVRLDILRMKTHMSVSNIVFARKRLSFCFRTYFKISVNALFSRILE